MRKRLFVLIAICCTIGFARAEGKGTTSITASAIYSNIFNISNVTDGTASGFGGYVYGDYQFLDWMALGLGGGETAYSKYNKISCLESIDVLGRLIFTNPRGSLTPYLIVGFGYRPFNKGKDDYYQGHYHGMVGVGGRIKLTRMHTSSGLDIALILNGDSPQKTDMKTGDIRIGYSIAFGGSETKTSSKKSDAVSDTVSNSEAFIPKSRFFVELAEGIDIPALHWQNGYKEGRGGKFNVGYGLFKNLAVQLDVESFKYSGVNAFFGTISDSELLILPTLRYNFHVKRIHPYLLAGAGTDFESLSSTTGKDSLRMFDVAVGAGLDIQLAGQTAVFVESKYNFVFANRITGQDVPVLVGVHLGL
jgi:hypothetical protein